MTRHRSLSGPTSVPHVLFLFGHLLTVAQFDDFEAIVVLQDLFLAVEVDVVGGALTFFVLVGCPAKQSEQLIVLVLCDAVFLSVVQRGQSIVSARRYRGTDLNFLSNFLPSTPILLSFNCTFMTALYSSRPGLMPLLKSGCDTDELDRLSVGRAPLEDVLVSSASLVLLCTGEAFFVSGGLP